MRMGTNSEAGPREAVRRHAIPADGLAFVDTPLLRVGRRLAGPNAGYCGTSQTTGETPIVAFTHAPIRVRFEADDPVVLTGATLATPGGRHEYITQPLTDRGEATTFIGFSDDSIARMCAEHDPLAADRPDRPVSWTMSPADERAAAAACRLTRMIFGHDEPIDRTWLEESVLTIVHRSIDASYRSRGGAVLPKDDPIGGEAVRAVCAHIGAHYGQPLGVSDLAAIAGYSPGYFCRKFRKHTGMSIHRYLLRVRMMAVVERLPEREGQIARLAHETGFASHAHLTSAFRQAIGATPSRVRERGLAWWHEQLGRSLERARAGSV